METHPLNGVVIPLMTPMDRPGAVTLAPVRDYLRALAEARIATVMPLGGNGEGPSIDPVAATGFVSHVVEQWRDLGGRLVLGGVIAADTREALVRGEALVGCGVDALVVSPPIYFRHTSEEIATHFAAFADLGVPIIAYDNRKYSGNPIGAGVVRRLVEMPHVVGVKDSSADFDNLLSSLELSAERPDFGVNVGDERTLLKSLRAGAIGITPGTGNFAPGLVQRIWEGHTAGRDEDATAADELAAALAGVHAIRPGIPTAKGILSLRGVIPAHASLPFRAWSAKEAETVREFLAPFEAYLIPRRPS